MTIYDAIAGTIMQKTGIIPNTAIRPRIIYHTRDRVDKYTDKCIYIVKDGYGDIYKLVFNLHLNAEYEIVAFKAIYAGGCF